MSIADDKASLCAPEERNVCSKSELPQPKVLAGTCGNLR